MKLLIDFGNTQTKCVLLHNGNLSASKIITPEELTTLIQKHTVSEVYYASVAPQQQVEPYLQLLVQHAIPCYQIESEAKAHNVINAYADYQTLGIDRWLGLIGAAAEFPNRNLIILDAGTALTVDALYANGQHAGGWIIPGVHLQIEAIVRKAPKVFSNEASGMPSEIAFARTTPENVSFGSLAAAVGACQLAVTHFKSLINEEPLVIVTGGDGLKFASLLACQSVLRPSLVFSGLACYATNNG